MKKVAAAIVVLFAPLAASIVWLIGWIIRSKTVLDGDDKFALNFSTLYSDPTGAWKMILVGWIVGLIPTCTIGLPLGYLTAFVLRKFHRESGLIFAICGAIEGALTILVWFAVEHAIQGTAQFWTIYSFREFGPSGAVVGLILGLSYWHLVRKRTVQLA